MLTALGQGLGRRRETLWLLGLMVVVGALYLRTLLPEVGHSGDTAKFQFVGRYLGTPHATGYPTYIFLSHIFTRLVPFGTVAYRANLLSAVFTVLGLAFVYRILRLLDVDPPVSFAAAALLGFTPTLWLHSLFAEVYTLHFLFMSASIFFLLRWIRGRRRRDLLIGAAVYAFSFGNHLTSLWLLPSIALAVWITDRRALLDTSILLPVAGFVLLSASQYTYFVWRTFDPTTPYLEMRASSLKEFLWFASGGPFRSAMFAFTPGELIAQRLPMFGGKLMEEFGLFLGIAALGAIVARGRLPIAFLGLYFLANAGYALNYGIPDIDAYFIPNYLVTAVFVGLGLNYLVRRLPSRLGRFAPLLVVMLPLLPLVSNFPRVDQSRNLAKVRETLAVLRAAKEDAVIVVPNYDVYEYLTYYRIAGGWGDRGFHLYHKPDLESAIGDVKAYLSQGIPLAGAAPGEQVYFAGVTGSQVEAIRASGLVLLEVKEDLLFEVEGRSSRP